MNKIDTLINNYETFDDDELRLNCSPVIEELDENINIDVPIKKNRINKINKEIYINDLSDKLKDNLKNHSTFLDTAITREEDCKLNKIDEKIKFILKKYDNQNIYKETPVSGVQCNIYGTFFLMKKGSKLRISYLNSEKDYAVIKIKDKLIDARKLLFETFICSSEDLKLSYKNKNKKLNELRNINFEIINEEQNL
jgi:hypothetical protein